MELEVLVAAIGAGLTVGAFGIYRWVSQKRAQKEKTAAGRDISVPSVSAPATDKNPEPKKEEKSSLAQSTVAEPPIESAVAQSEAAIGGEPSPALSAKLTRTRSSLLGKLTSFFGKNAAAIPQEEWEALEEVLLAGDVGVSTTQKLLQALQSRAKNGSSGRDLKDLIQEESEALLHGLSHGEPNLSEVPSPYVISIVGVNGAGKTTTIGKMAQRFHQAQKRVLLGACDTFRAAAIGQLKVWAERANAQFVTGREGADPGAVAFDSVTAAKARGIDIVLLDTAGRLHTKTNLMEELKKIHRVIKKVIPEAPHETWLVLDGTSGQNAVQQAREFQKVLELSGVIITKLDGTAKGGAILSVANELKLPIKFIGVGEGIEDLIPFDPKPFVEAILGGNLN